MLNLLKNDFNDIYNIIMSYNKILTHLYHSAIIIIIFNICPMHCKLFRYFTDWIVSCSSLVTVQILLLSVKLIKLRWLCFNPGKGIQIN